MQPKQIPSRGRALWSLARPHQWTKNAFVLSGLIFAHEWSNSALTTQALIAVLAFCLTSSALYAFNDICDMAMDKLHPQKSQRPLPAGHLPKRWAQGAALFLGLAGLGTGAAASLDVMAFVAAYLLVGISYTLWFKRIVILDVFGISAGFMLRLLAGTAGIGIHPTHWLLFCGLMLTIFLASAKRWTEINALKTQEAYQRPVLQHYSPLLLDKMMTISATAALMSYSLYTISPETVAKYKTENLIYTVPFVAYGLFRYIYLLAQGGGTDIALDVIKDVHMRWTILVWLVSVCLLTYRIHG